MEKQTLLLKHNYRPAKNASENPPAIIMLHGFGSDENDLFSFANELPEKYAIISLKAPIRLEPYGNAWYNIYFDNSQGKFSDDEQAIASRELVSKCIDEVVEKYKVDKNNITLLGFSQGTILSFAVALSYPEKVKNVIGLSGYINEEILKEGYATNDFSNLKVYTSHGSVDQVIPVQWARKTEPFLKKLNIDCKYSEFPVGHGVAPQNFYELKSWLDKN
ncbi:MULTISPECIES: alpha/beta hydrolase [Aequorivita]|uniref:Alpha/beta fold hydrolase n=1 Tax=Aequorivita iocasae TaxID=2803865 RepID=A0ABX7DQD8_9FLAO|nr:MULTISPECIES: alpha/beta fold hydrolase [Aequorivita]QQX76340.1 alpha/beta fold hydrolase [Aequorivita iocasae]UCA55805.1 alpha/beta fold hydrolase [Aequorivita sp. F7]